MADNEIKKGSAPVFVHAYRPPGAYGGPAVPVALWGIARQKVGVEGLCDEQQKLDVMAVYYELCQALPSAELTLSTEKTEEVILGELGRSALGGSREDSD
ncbi:MAG TPA: hypothetical protein PJ984_02205 [Candidatus Saccharibacteria bacterium]|jgi:hypothetical protein|nr:hypothetical protein [Candidatus Saccharibacteria bacterium]